MTSSKFCDITLYLITWGKHKCTHAGDAGAVCTECQMGIGGIYGVNCKACSINGAGNCDLSGCPGIFTYYNNVTKLCEIKSMKIKPYECDDNHRLANWNIDTLKIIYDTVNSNLECVYMCLLEENEMCTDTDYIKNANRCNLYTSNKYTVFNKEYLRDNANTHCAVGFCPPGQAMTINKTCFPYPVNHYKLY